MKKFLKNLLKLLGVKPKLGGLEISPNFLRYIEIRDKEIFLKSVRLPQGTIVNNEIKNYDAFLEALNYLHAQIFSGKQKEKDLNVSVCLNLNNFYTQVFSLPFVNKQNLKEGLSLNIQMVAPQSLDKLYASHQIIYEDLNSRRVDVLSVFINKNIVNDIIKALFDSKFVLKTIEPYSTAIIRSLKKLCANFDPSKNYLIVSLNDVGVLILISRNSNLYFEYYLSWEEIIGDKKNILWSELEKKIIYNVNQVINFYNSKFTENLEGVVVVSRVFLEEIKNAIKSNFNLKVFSPDLSILSGVDPSWLGALGAQIRSQIPLRKDDEINLTGFELEDEFMHRQIIQFFEVWRLGLGIFLGILVLVMFGFNLFLTQYLNSLKNEQQEILAKDNVKEIETLRGKIENFNNLTSMVKKIESSYTSRYFILNKISQKLNENNIELINLSFDDDKKSVFISAKSINEENIINFKKSLETDSFFSSVDLPLQNIKTDNQGKTFSVSFSVNLSKTP
jgi:uncharacterized membrane-anchored protein YhcB (DUF1043 family)